MTVVTEGIVGLLSQVSIRELCEEMKRRGWKCDGSRGTFEPEAIEVWAHFGVTIDPKAVIRFEQSGGGYVDVPVSAIVEEFVSLSAPEANFAEVLNAAPPQGGAEANAAPSGFEAELSALLNRHSMEADSNTPDFLLARFLVEILHAFGSAVHWRDKHYQFNPWGASLPTAEQNPNGLHQRYRVEKLDGPIDPRAIYFVLRLDRFGRDPVQIDASRIAARAYADAVEGTHLEQVGQELRQLIVSLALPPFEWSYLPMIAGWYASTERMEGNARVCWCIKLMGTGGLFYVNSGFLTDFEAGFMGADLPSFPSLEAAKDFAWREELRIQNSK